MFQALLAPFDLWLGHFENSKLMFKTLKLELGREMIRQQGKVKKEEGIIRFISDSIYFPKDFD